MNPRLRRIRYLSGTRADFGLMRSTLVAIASDARFQLDVVAAGTHLSKAHGFTIKEIEEARLHIAARIELDTSTASGESMALNIARTIEAMVLLMAADRPDALLLLGDRGEMLAGAVAALNLGIPIVHVHGGERSGTVDELVRHAISKLSHYHFVSTAQSRDRLLAMGESADRVFVTGAPGLDGLIELASRDRSALCAELALDAGRPVALFIFHPVSQDATEAEIQARRAIDACLTEGLQIVTLMPNTDAGSTGIRTALDHFERHPDVRVAVHLPRADFVSWMAACDVMVGNSSSGIIEAGSFGVPVINIGSRQHLRERNSNVLDVPHVDASFGDVVRACLARGRGRPSNVYGDGHAGERMIALLADIDLGTNVLSKVHAH